METLTVSVDGSVKIVDSACQLQGEMEVQPARRYAKKHRTEKRLKCEGSLSPLSLAQKNGSHYHTGKDTLLAYPLTNQPLARPP